MCSDMLFFWSCLELSEHELFFVLTMEWRPKKRNAPPLPARRAVHAHSSGKRVRVEISDDEEDWLATGGPAPTVNPTAVKLTCTPDVATSAAATSAPVVKPVPVKPAAVALSFDDIIRKYPPLKIRVVAEHEADDWLDEK